MRERLKTADGIAAYRQRGHIAETPHGHIKHNMGLRQLSVRGKPKASRRMEPSPAPSATCSRPSPPATSPARPSPPWPASQPRPPGPRAGRATPATRHAPTARTNSATARLMRGILTLNDWPGGRGPARRGWRDG